MDVGGPKEMDPQGGAKGEGAQPPVEKQPKKKKAGVESFTVEWSKGLTAGPTAANLRLDYNAKFKKDDDHDPALAEFRQNAMTRWEIRIGTLRRHRHARAKSWTSEASAVFDHGIEPAARVGYVGPSSAIRET